MQPGMGEIVGRRIVGVYLRLRDSAPQGQVLLAFEDGTACEFYSDKSPIWPRAVPKAEGYLKGGQRFSYEAKFDETAGEIVERQYAGEIDMKGDRIVRYAPPSDWQPTAVEEEAGWVKFLRRAFTNSQD